MMVQDDRVIAAFESQEDAELFRWAKGLVAKIPKQYAAAGTWAAPAERPEVVEWIKRHRRDRDPGPVLHVTDQMFDWLTQYATDHADDLGCDLTIQQDGLWFGRCRVMPQPPTGDLPEADTPAVVPAKEGP